MKQGRSGKTKGDPGRDKPAAAAGRRPPHQAPPPLGTGFARRLWPAALLIFLVVIIIYLPALRGGFIWDDDDYVTQNLALRTLSGLGQIWFKLGVTSQYYPLVFTSFWIDYHLWGLNSLGYHAVNVLLHAGSAVLLWLTLRRLGVRGAWLAGLLFAVHPVAAESVAWVTERKNTLSTLLYLLSFMAMVRFYRLDGAADGGKSANRHEPEFGSWWFYGIALALYAAALFSKTVTCTLPAAVLIVLWWKRGRMTMREMLSLTPLFALGAAMGLLTAWMEKHFVRAQGVDWTLSLLDRGLLAGRVIWFYLAKLAWPAGLTFIYPRWKIDAGAWWQYLYPLGVGALLLGLWLGRRRIGRGPLAALLFFVATLFPALGFVDVYPMRYSFVADHFQYLAMIGPIVLAGALGAAALGRLTPATRPAGMALLAALAAVLGALTWSQGYNYKDAKTLWTNNLARNPDALIAINNLGVILLDEGDRQRALGYFERALAAHPDSAQVHVNLANCLMALNRNAEALAHETAAQRLQPTDPRPPFNIGILMLRLGRQDEAIAAFEKSLDLNPSLIEAHFNLADLLAGRRRFAEAIAHYHRVCERAPIDPSAAVRLAWLLATVPDAALRNGREAVALADRACQVAGGNPQYLDTLAAAYAEAGRFQEAIPAAQKAIELALAAGNQPLAQIIDARLRLYQARRPYHEEPAASQAN